MASPAYLRLRMPGRMPVPRRHADCLKVENRRVTPRRSNVTFQTFAGEWDASPLPMYKHSTRSIGALW
jgi:hypothetical protein